MAKMKTWEWILVLLVLIGGINWGLIGLFNFDLVAKIFAGYAKWIYILVGISALYGLYGLLIKK